MLLYFNLDCRKPKILLCIHFYFKTEDKINSVDSLRDELLQTKLAFRFWVFFAVQLTAGLTALIVLGSLAQSHTHTSFCFFFGKALGLTALILLREPCIKPKPLRSFAFLFFASLIGINCVDPFRVALHKAKTHASFCFFIPESLRKRAFDTFWYKKSRKLSFSALWAILAYLRTN